MANGTLVEAISTPTTPVNVIERYLPLIAVASFAAGMLPAMIFPFTHGLTVVLDGVSEFYVYVAPVVIFMILAPSLLKLTREKGASGTRFTMYTIGWFAGARFLGLLFSVGFCAVAFGLPMHSARLAAADASVINSVLQVLETMAYSPYFWAVYASIGTCLLLRRSEHPWAAKFARIPDAVEAFGKYITYIVPVFMFLMGIYIVTLPAVLQEGFGGTTAALQSLTIFGFTLPTETAGDFFLVYVALAVLTGIGVTLWHGGLLLYARRVVPVFRIRYYLRTCFARVYPLLWATSSEALATPLVLHLIRQHYPDLNPAVRRFCAGLGAFININGTLLCVFVITAAVAHLVGFPIGWFDLLLAIPAVFILGYGVPGIPGELVLFAGPMMAVLGVPLAAESTFLLVFLGLQIGLPDSFRTAGNSTDVFPATFILHQRYEERYAHTHADDQRLDDEVGAHV